MVLGSHLPVTIFSVLKKRMRPTSFCAVTVNCEKNLQRLDTQALTNQILIHSDVRSCTRVLHYLLVDVLPY